jgi:predicted Zn-dependent protease
MDDELSRRVGGGLDIRQFTAKLEEAIQITCREMYRIKETSTPKAEGRMASCWKDELQVLRKRTNALRRRYQRTTNNETLRENRKGQYNKAKADYQIAIKREKSRSWKKFCTLTPANNPWNEVYKIATGKTRNKQTITILQRPDGTVTETTQ